jgi:hypothetical protein
LGVHHSGDLKNPVSSWFANNLDFVYQPQFYHNNTDLDVSRNNWPTKVEEMVDYVDDFAAENHVGSVYFGSAYVMSDQITCVLNIDASNKSAAELFVAVYVFENNVVNNQSSRGMSLHPNVLRDVMNENNFGDRIIAGNTPYQEEFNLDMNPNWDKDNLGLLAVVYEKLGSSYSILNASSIHNIGLLSSSQEILNKDVVRVSYLADGFNINTADSEEYKLYFYNSNAQLIHEQVFSGNTFVETLGFPSGIYSIHLHQDNKVYTQQVFVK